MEDPTQRIEPSAVGDSFLLSVDDAGRYLVACGKRLILGHAHAGRADLPFLADVGAAHAVLERRDSFREGSVWSIAALGREFVSVAGRPLGGMEPLAPGDEVRLGENLRFRFEMPDPGSQTALLHFPEGLDCAGARHVLLFAEGAGGRVRIGSAEHRHIRVANLGHEVTLERSPGQLHFRSAEPIRGAPSREPEGATLPLPILRRFDLALGAAVDGRPPFGFCVGPREGNPTQP